MVKECYRKLSMNYVTKARASGGRYVHHYCITFPAFASRRSATFTECTVYLSAQS